MKTLILVMTGFLSVLFLNTSLAGGGSFLNVLRYEPDVNVIYNEINNVDWSSENLDIVQAVWNRNVEKYRDLPWERLDHDIVRLALANVLMQAHRHCRVVANMEELHDFVKKKTMSRDLRVRGRATYLLGLSGYEEDIPYLSSVVEAEHEGSAEEAALSLSFIHSDAALDAIRELEVKVNRPSLKKFLRELIDKYQTYPIIDSPKTCQGAPERNDSNDLSGNADDGDNVKFLSHI